MSDSFTLKAKSTLETSWKVAPSWFFTVKERRRSLSLCAMIWKKVLTNHKSPCSTSIRMKGVNRNFALTFPDFGLAT